MELWASGFNAWGQLQFDKDGDLTEDPRDISLFECILKDPAIEFVRSSVSAVLINTSTGFKVAGSLDDFNKLCSEKKDALPNVVIAGNDLIAAYDGNNLKQYSSLDDYEGENGNTLRQFDRLQQLVSNETSFTALTSAGTVYTWGDGRFESCLSRQVSEHCPASTPCLVEDLLDLPTGKIRKISSGGYVTAAITTGNDLYVWGGRPGQPKLLEQMEGYPTPVDLEGLDILDVAVGDNHMLALTTDHKLFVVGAGGNGQLGLGSEIKVLEDWGQIDLPLEKGQTPVAVYAGYKSSFVVVE